jgi:hypothetical protein
MFLRASDAGPYQYYYMGKNRRSVPLVSSSAVTQLFLILSINNSRPSQFSVRDFHDGTFILLAELQVF